MKRSQLIFALAGLGVSLLLPLVVRGDYHLQVLFRIYLFAALGLAWNLVGGYTGQLSLGHAAFFGAGAYGLALFTHAGLPIGIALVLLVALAMAFALLIGGVAFRLRGPYFALATIAFAEVLRAAAKNLPKVTGGDVGIQVPALFHDHVQRSFCYCAILLAAAALAATAVISRSRFGYYLMAIREDQDTALSVGVHAARTKLDALLVSAAFTALGGALYASLFLFIVPDQVLSIDISNEIAIAAMLGGAGTLAGPLVGALVLESAAELFKNVFQEAHLLIYGLLLIVVVLFLPEGIVGGVASVLRRQRRRNPQRKAP